MAGNSPVAYGGKEPFVFISYSHKDTARVIPIIEGLQRKGIRVWYDDGITLGSRWDQSIPRRIGECACVLCLVSKNFVLSDNCQDEVFLAKEEKKGPLVVYLENTELSLELKYHIGRLHALNLVQLGSVQTLVDQLVQSEQVRNCKEITRSAVSTTSVPKAAPAPQPRKTEVQKPAGISETEIAKMSGKELFEKARQLKGNGLFYKDDALRLMEASAEKGYAYAMEALADHYYHKSFSKYDEETIRENERGIYWRKKYIQSFGLALDSHSRHMKNNAKEMLRLDEEQLAHKKAMAKKYG